MVHFRLKPSGGIFRPQIYEMQLKFKPLDSFGLAVKGRHSTKVTVNNKANKHTIKQTFGRVDKCSNIPCGPSIRTRVDCRCRVKRAHQDCHKTRANGKKKKRELKNHPDTMKTASPDVENHNGIRSTESTCKSRTGTGAHISHFFRQTKHGKCTIFAYLIKIFHQFQHSFMSKDE